MAGIPTGPGSEYYKYLKYKKGDSFFGQLASTFADKGYCWCPVAGAGYLLGEIQKIDKDVATVKIVSNSEIVTIKGKDKLLDVNPPKFDGTEDCATLSHLNEPAVFHNLKVRYEDELIYTYSGLFLVAVNPYKRIPVYTPQMVELYKGKRPNEMAPHIFAISDLAYRQMINNREDQSMLITGESGAGKTENTKKVIQYLATISGRVQDGDTGTLEQQILECNPILETFGNARTLKNDNSSRFGKFIRLQFSAGGAIIGASIQSYLLEKSRVVWQAQGERNFHVFYQLTAGTNAEEKEKYKVGGPDKYFYTNQSGCYTVPGLNEREEFLHTNEAMQIIGFSDEEIDSIFKAVSAILHMGNIVIEAGPGESSVIAENGEIDIIASLLSIDPKQFATAIVKPRIKAGRDVVQTSLTPEKAKFSRDALVKSLYGRLFLYIVRKINMSIAQDSCAYFIGVLDIAGFEIFKDNNFEQMCINYTNERLQQFFNNHMFKLEQEEYAREKINWTFIDFGMDSQDRIDLIDKKPIGILALLEEECFFPKATDETFLAKLNGAHSRNAYFKKPKFQKGCFCLQHYAGEVEYSVTGWLDKNKDPLQDDLKITMKASKNPLYVALFGDDFELSLDPKLVSGATKSSDKSGSMSGSLGSMNKKGKGANFITVAMAHKEQLADLMDTLGATSPHFVRCIIPNHQKLPGHLVSDLVLEQLRCNGVLEGIKISRKGFPNRVLYSEFVRRYYILVPRMARDESDVRAASEKIVNEMKLDPELVRWGLTKVFFRVGQLAKIEEAREVKISQMLVNVQAGARGWLGRRVFKRLRSASGASKIVQRNCRAWLDFQTSLWYIMFQKVKPLIKRRNYDAEIAEAGKVVVEAKAKLAAAQAENAATQKELNELLAQLKDVDAKLKAETAVHGELSEEAKRLKRLKEELQEKVDELTAKLESSSNVNSALIKAKRAALDKITELTAKLDGEKKTVQNLEKIKADHIAQIKDLEEQRDAREANIARMRKAQAGVESELAELEKMLEAERDNSSKLDKANRVMQMEHGDLQADLDDVNAANAELAKRKALLEAELAELKDDLEKERAGREAALAEQRRLQGEYDELYSKASAGGAKAAELAALKARLEQELQDARDAHEAAFEARAKLEREKKSKESELEDLRDKITEEVDKTDNINNLIKKREAERVDLKAQLEAALAKIDQLQRLIKNLEQQVTDLKATLVKEQEAHLAAQRAKKATEAALEEASRAADELANARAALERQKKKLDSDAKDTKSALDDEKHARELLDRGNRTLEGDVEEAKRFAESGGDAAADLESKKKALERALDDAKSAVDASTDAKAKAERLRREAETALADLRDEIRELEDQLDNQNTSLRRSQADLADAKDKYERAIDSKAKNEQGAKSIAAQVNELKEQIEQAEVQKTRMDRDKSKNEALLSELEDKLTTDREERIKAERALAKLEADLREAKHTDASSMSAEKIAQLGSLEKQLLEARELHETELAAKSSVEKSKRLVETELAEANEGLEDALAGRNRVDRLRRELEEKVDEMRLELDRAGANVEIESLRSLHLRDMEELRKKLDYEAETRARYDAARKALGAEISDVRAALEEEQRARAGADRQRKTVEANMESVREQLDAAAREKAKAQKEARKQEKDLKAAKVDAITRGGGTVTEETRKLMGEIGDARDQLARLQRDKQNEDRSARTLQEEIESLRQDLDIASKSGAATGKKTRLEEELADLQQQLEAIETEKEEAEEADKKAEAELEKIKKELEDAIASKKRADENYRTMQVQIERTKKVIDDERRGKTDAERTKRRAEAELEDVRSRLDSELRNKERADKAKKKSEKDLRDATKKLLDKERVKAEAEKKVFRINEELQHAKARADHTQKEIDTTMALKRQVDSQIETVQDQADAERKARIRTERARRELENEAEALKSQIEDASASKGGHDSALTAIRTAREEARKKAEFLQANKDRLEDQKRDLERDIMGLRLRLDGVQKQQNQNEAKKHEKDDALTILKGNLEEELKLRQKAESAQEKAEAAVAEAHALLMESGTKDSGSSKATVEMAAEASRLRERIDNDSRAHKELETEKRRLQDEINAAKDRLRRLEDQITAAKDEISREKAQKQRIDAKLGSAMGSTAEAGDDA